MRIRSAWLAAFLLCGFAAGAVAQERDLPAIRKVGGAIDNAEAWNGEILVEQDVSVGGEGRLTILPGTRVRFANGSGLTVVGTFEAVGSAASPIQFLSAEVAPSETAWKGITLEGSGEGSVLRHVVVASAEAVRVKSGSAVLEDCSLEDGRTGVLVFRNAEARVTRCTISRMAAVGVECQSGSRAIVDNCAIRGCGGAGVAAQRNSDLGVLRTAISGCQVGALYATVSPPPEGNRLDNNSVGILLDSVGDGMSILRNEFTGNEVGLRVENFSNPRLEGNTFERNGTGIFCFRSSSPSIVRNRFAGNGQGIVCSQLSAPAISANEFEGNSAGVVLTLSSYATVRGNNFENNAVQMKLDNMSHDWEVKVGRKPERGNAARSAIRASKGFPSPAGGKPDGVVGEGRIDASGNWWGKKDTAEMDDKGPDANIEGLVDGHDVPTRAYEGYPGEYLQDRINYKDWKPSRIPDAGLPDSEREDSAK